MCINTVSIYIYISVIILGHQLFEIQKIHVSVFGKGRVNPLKRHSSDLNKRPKAINDCFV